MKACLTRVAVKIYWLDEAGPMREGPQPRVSGDLSRVSGDLSGVSGNVSGVSGDVSGVSGDLSRVWGDLSGVSGDLSRVSGNVSGVSGNLSGVSGNLTGVRGDLDDAGTTDEERERGIKVEDLLLKSGQEPILGDCDHCGPACDAFPCANADPSGPPQIAKEES